MDATTRRTILVADDEPNLRKVLTAQLRRDGYDVKVAQDGQQAIEAIAGRDVDVVVTDLRMPRVDGMEVLKHVVAHHPHLPVIVITAHGTVDTAVEALKLGAFDYVTKPFDRDELKLVIDKAARTGELNRLDVEPVVDGAGRFRIIGGSAAMAEVYRTIEKVADTPSTVLVTGESGTGKELVAMALHENSRRRDKPFIRVNCAAIPPDLLESELFGYEKGAFTGAVTSKPGRFELADEGTLFLDEIGDIPVSMQVKLLRALQEQEFERVGGIKTLSVDVRLVAATNRDLKADIASGRFREDLYYRLNVVQVPLPPLRERQGDIPLLIEHFVGKMNARLGREVTRVSHEAEQRLMAYAWPGNIRELENVIERCLLFCDGDTIDVEHLPSELRPPSTKISSAPPPRIEAEASEELAATSLEGGLKEAVKVATSRIERDLIVRALEETEGNVTQAAKKLQISRKSLQTKMKELGLRGTS